METNAERRAKIYPIILKDYNPEWPKWFEEEKTELARILGDNIVRISHVGSTAVPGLLSKPTVDIQIEISEDADVEKLIAAFPSEYICLYPPDMATLPPHLTVIKGYLLDGFADRVFHIHFGYSGDDDRLCFRDYLIAHPEIAADYAELKLRLLKDFEHDRDGYTEAKGEFVRAITERARFFS